MTLKNLLRSGGAICHDCAKTSGATWPEGHVATHFMAKCPLCNKDTCCCDVFDYDWPDFDAEKRREL